eukprot:m.134545 g.134545  ORF g.134545 m.134545 type:complete len:173 (-) comp9632_c0_seq1:1435-1953(-)
MDDDSTNNLAELFQNTNLGNGHRAHGHGRERSASESVAANLKREWYAKSKKSPFTIPSTSSSLSTPSSPDTPTSSINDDVFTLSPSTSSSQDTLERTSSLLSTSEALSPPRGRERRATIGGPPQSFGLFDFFASLARSPSSESLSSTSSKKNRARAHSSSDDFAVSSSGMGL